MQLGQFSATISVDGVALPEYAVEYSADGLEATCWIASERDKPFRVNFQDIDFSPHRQISARLFVDGKGCNGRLLKAVNGSNISTGMRDSVASSANTRRPLKFAQQCLTDDDSYLNTAIPAQLGTINVAFWHVKLHRGNSIDSAVNRGDLEATVLHERSKKAMGHSVQFGPEYYRMNYRLESTRVKTLATLIFRYRPIGLLRAEGIAPPEPGQIPNDVSDLTMDVEDADAEDEDAQIKKLEKQLESLKKKKQTKQPKPEHSTVKQEIKPEQSVFQPGEVIDLT
ncbi:hypothetical protein R3P38DRAFT_3037422 [Favolaschia claudopus]|uniref:DUF7918 domain-containing protein n=1 Tax=Favolaschia claudopus TaxID=2862362 RepID=A0AAW0ABL8_9AGAR